MKRFRVRPVAICFTLLCLAGLGAVAYTMTRDEKKPETYRTIWEQDFRRMSDDSKLDPTRWYIADRTEPIYNDEAQLYDNSEKNVYIKDGALILKARYAEDNVLTSGKVDMRSGSPTLDVDTKVEVSAKMPKGAGTWPAFLVHVSEQTTHYKAQSDHGGLGQQRFLRPRRRNRRLRVLRPGAQWYRVNCLELCQL